MSNLVRHPYHLVDESPWPLYSAAGAFFTTSGLVKWFVLADADLLVSAMTVTLIIMLLWWRDVSAEASLQGYHSYLVELGLRYGMLLFIASEVMFFFSFFWAFFHSSVSPSVDLGIMWPPIGVNPFNPLEVPLLNTIILLSSGISVTWAHHALMSSNHREAMTGLTITVSLGVYFTVLQGWEYHEASFSLAEGVFGSTFFIATGFHGLHVIIGSSFLLFTLMRLNKGILSPHHHFGFEAAAWYWHFVDVVWLFLYVSIYWWGGM